MWHGRRRGTHLALVCLIGLSELCPRISADDSWEQRMLASRPTIDSLLRGYRLRDADAAWDERRAALTTASVGGDVELAVSAALCLACGRASFEDDVAGALARVREIAETHGDKGTVVRGWSPSRGCVISEAWIALAPRKPFGRDGSLDALERETIAYFEHLQRVPVSVGHVAMGICAAMSLAQEDTAEAIVQLERAVIDQWPALEEAVLEDRIASGMGSGYYIGNVFPLEAQPIWRPQYSAAVSLASLYAERGESRKSLHIVRELAAAVSPDGWYPRINEIAAGRLEAAGMYAEAAAQYRLAARGTETKIAEQIRRKGTLFSEGLMAKGPDFVSWDHEVRVASGWQAVVDALAAKAEKADADAP